MFALLVECLIYGVPALTLYFVFAYYVSKFVGFNRLDEEDRS